MFSGSQRTRLGAYGVSRQPYGSFAGRGEAPPEVVVTALTGGGSGAKRKKYPRRVFINGRVVVVQNAAQERQLMAELSAKAKEQAAIAQALGDEVIAKVIEKKAAKLERRVEAVDTRERDWLQRLRDEDEEIISILFS